MMRTYAQKGTVHGPNCISPPKPPVEFSLLPSGIASTMGNMDMRTKGATAAAMTNADGIWRKESGIRVVWTP
jgi:hypothetical protein